MGAIRKPRFSDCVVEKAMDGFFNNLLDDNLSRFRRICGTAPVPDFQFISWYQVVFMRHV
jgi:hypothetical protein